MMALLGAAVLWKYQAWIIFGVALWISWKVYVVQVEPRLRERRLRRAAERESLLLRADYENRQYLEAGLYEGQYPAETLPLVTDGQLMAWYDYKHDDGLTEWK